MGGNLLVAGGEDTGNGLLMATLLSAAIRGSPADVAFTVVRFAKPSSPFHGFWDLARRLPHEVRIAGQRTAVAELAALIADLDERLGDGGDVRGPERFFIVAGLHRWPELAAERDYRPSEEPRPWPCSPAWPTSGRKPGSTWWRGPAVTRAPSARCAAPVSRISACAQCSGCPRPRKAKRCSPSAPGADSLAGDRALFRDMDEPDEIEKFKPYSIASLRAFAETAFPSTP